MNERINFQELIALLSEEKQISKKDSEFFLRELFSLVMEGVLSDGVVKIKDLGSFKTVQVNARESVNIQTGKRVLIPAHQKVSFSPDKKLSELVNAPYAHLEITELEDQAVKTKEDPVEDVEIPVKEKDDPVEIKEEVVEVQHGEDKKLIQDEFLPVNEELTEPGGSSEAPISVDDVKPESVSEEKKEDEIEIATEMPSVLMSPPLKDIRISEKKNNSLFWSPLVATCVVVCLVIGLSFGVYFFITHSSKKEYLSTLKSVEDRTKTSGTSTPEVKDTIIPFGGKPIVVEPVENPDSSIATEKDALPAKVTGLKEEKTITIARGERLTLISLREYGDKVFWVYLYLNNKDVIEDPNNVSPGTVIKIPAPGKYDIDKNNRTSVLKATKLMQEILNSASE